MKSLCSYPSGERRAETRMMNPRCATNAGTEQLNPQSNQKPDSQGPKINKADTDSS